MARITRKELKSDKFAQEVGLTVTFFEEHQKDVVRYGGLGVAVALLIIGFFIYQKHGSADRQEELAAAIHIQETPVATVAISGQQTFQTQAAKDEAALKAFADLQSKHSGSDEAAIAEYYIGSIHADQGKLADAERNFLDVADHASKNYASLAKVSLSELYFSDGRNKQGEDVLKDLVAHPTIFVSADQASITLAKHYIAIKNYADARKMLSPIKDRKSEDAAIAQQLYSTIPPQ